MNARTTETVSATDLLRGDHRRIKELFRDFQAVDRETRGYIARTAIEEIELHSFLEEKLFYPTVRAQVEDAEALVTDSEESHHLAKLLIAELRVIPYGDRYYAKFCKLAENVTSHIQEEEEQLFPIVEKSDLDLEQLGLEMAHLKMRALSRRLPSETSSVSMGWTAGLMILGAAAAIAFGFLSRNSRGKIVEKVRERINA